MAKNESKPLAVMGIDPGHEGGLAFMNMEGDGVFVCVMPKIRAQAVGLRGRRTVRSKPSIDVVGLANWIRACQELHKIELCMLESVHAMPRQGVVSMFTFGKGYGEVIGVLTTLGIHIRYVEPRAWKEAILQGTEKDKEAAIAWCRANYPNVNLLMTPRARVPHDGVADALCLCEYARRLLPSEMGIYS